MTSDSLVVQVSTDEVMQSDIPARISYYEWALMEKHVTDLAKQVQKLFQKEAATRKAMAEQDQRLDVSARAYEALKLAHVHTAEEIEHLQLTVLEQNEWMQGLSERIEALEQRDKRQKPWHAEPMIARVNLP